MRKMKDSGFEWIGDIPQEWGAKRLKFLAENLDTYRQAVTANQRNQEAEVLYDYFGASGAIDKIDGYTIDDHVMLIGEDGANLLLRNLPLMYEVNGKAWINNHAHILKPKQIIEFYYLFYTLESSDIRPFITGSAQPKLNQEKMNNIPLPYPTLLEQQAIAKFLDHKCSEIDALTADIQSEIETLEEYKRSVIAEAVTKGLDPDVEMKDSGVEWVGNIPTHWNVHPLYYYFGERKNRNIFGNERNLLSLSYGNVIRKDIDTNGGLLPESFNTYNIVEKGDIIIRPTDLQNDKRSLRTGLVKEHGIITSAYIALKAMKNINVEYAHYLLHAFDVMKVFYNMGNGVRQGLNYSEFSRLPIFEPTIEEQTEIVAYLGQKCAEIDSIISDKKKQLETLSEYKKSLIYEYVTGKKEV